jgi:hypothetical protein
VIGTLTIGGQPAPVGTGVTLTFNGAPGPSAAVRVAGGYRVDFAAGGAGCANSVGAAIAVVVNGKTFAAGTVGGGEPVIRVDIALP